MAKYKPDANEKKQQAVENIVGLVDAFCREHLVATSSATTSLVHKPNGEIRWWTFAGGVANELLADALKPHCDMKGDNLSLSLPTASSLGTVSEYINGVERDSVRPILNVDSMEHLKFSEYFSPEIAAEVFTSQFDDRAGVRQALAERRRVVVQQS